MPSLAEIRDLDEINRELDLKSEEVLGSLQQAEVESDVDVANEGEQPQHASLGDEEYSSQEETTMVEQELPWGGVEEVAAEGEVDGEIKQTQVPDEIDAHRSETSNPDVAGDASSDSPHLKETEE